MTESEVRAEHEDALSSLTPLQWAALARMHKARVRRWTRGGHERDHLRDIFREEAEALSVS